MTQTGCMASEEKYLTFGHVLVMLGTAVLDRFVCRREGHDPVQATDTIICRRCLVTVR